MSSARPRRTPRWLIVTVCAVVAVALGVGAWLLFRPRTDQVATTTRLVPVTRSTQTVTVGLSGTLAARNQASLSFASPGTVTSVKVKVGQKVAKNDVLARIDATDLRNSLALAEANLTAARTQLSEANDNNASSSQRTAARASVRSAEAQVAQAAAAVKKATLRSTMDGVVAIVGLAKGYTVTGGAPAAASASGTASTGVITVVNTATWKVNATIGAADVASLKTGQKATISVTGTTTTLDGTVDSVGVAATTSGGAASFPVVIRVSGSGTGVYSGVAVTASVITGTYPDVLAVPTAAIRTTAGQSTVQVSKNGQVTTVPITTGRVFGNLTEVTSGLSEGDEVVITTIVGGPGGRVQGPFPGPRSGAGEASQAPATSGTEPPPPPTGGPTG